MTKKLGLFLLLIAVFLLLGGCNLKEKIGESITEGLLEKAVGGDTDIDIDGGDFTIKGEDGEEVTFNDENGMVIEGEDGSVVSSGGDYKWPEDQAATYLPKVDKGKISYIFNSEQSCLIHVEGMKQDDYENYKEEVIGKGYDVDKVETAADQMQIYSAKSKENVVISVIFMTEEDGNEEGILQLSVDATGKQ